ncbi:HIT domain-containing protein [Xanthobacter sp. KR7-65]|uniref:HIT family protein n=1 Tax=Xanthobacter sp. KR7-65 TaxID=3156612 RepID=UPI0032B45A05
MTDPLPVDEAGFSLDPRLVADGPAAGDLPLCHLRLVEDARFFWVVLVPRRAGRVEIIDLVAADRLCLMEEIAAVSQVVKAASGCAKLNVAALGNMVPQLHVHVVARSPGDAAWPGPVFGAGTRQPLDAAERTARLCALRDGLDLA